MNNFLEKFTPREREVLELLVEGYSNPEIAQILHITTHTVKAHISSMYEKTNIYSRVSLAVKAYKAFIESKNN